MLDYKFFLNSRRTNAGIYMGGFVKFRNAYVIRGDKEIKNPETSNYIRFRMNSLSIGPMIGYQNYIKGRIVFDFIIGIELKKDFIKRYEVINTNYFAPSFSIEPRMEISVGYRF